MKPKNKERLALALDNAAEMIRAHVEIGLEPDDVNELDEVGLQEYAKACEKAFKQITRLANRYKLK